MGKERASTVVTHASVLQTGPEPRCVTNCPQRSVHSKVSHGKATTKLWLAGRVLCPVTLYTSELAQQRKRFPPAGERALYTGTRVPYKAGSLILAQIQNASLQDGRNSCALSV